MGANQSIDAGYACVGEDLSEVDKQYLITHTFLQKQGAREHGENNFYVSFTVLQCPVQKSKAVNRMPRDLEAGLLYRLPGAMISHLFRSASGWHRA